MQLSYPDTISHCQSCVLLFSGGRDSTVAAARLAGQCQNVVLLTISNSHLLGMEHVRSRIDELSPYFKGNGEWLHVAVSPSALRVPEVDLPGCLTCQHSYVAVAARVADQYGINHVALGYTAYQAGWVEQSPYAITRLSEVLATAGKTLILPANDLASKDQAKHMLRLLNLSEDALEQKCARQQTNDVPLDEETTRARVDQWAESLGHLLAERNRIEFRVLESKSVEATR